MESRGVSQNEGGTDIADRCEESQQEARREKEVSLIEYPAYGHDNFVQSCRNGPSPSRLVRFEPEVFAEEIIRIIDEDEDDLETAFANIQAGVNDSSSCIDFETYGDAFWEVFIAVHTTPQPHQSVNSRILYVCDVPHQKAYVHADQH